MSVDSLDFRPELEQALDCRLTLDGLEGVSLGDIVVASASLGGDVVPLLRRLAGGEGTSVEAWAGKTLLRELAGDLRRADAGRLFRELERRGEDEDEDGDQP